MSLVQISGDFSLLSDDGHQLESALSFNIQRQTLADIIDDIERMYTILLEVVADEDTRFPEGPEGQPVVDDNLFPSEDGGRSS